MGWPVTLLPGFPSMSLKHYVVDMEGVDENLLSDTL